jgi:hypothetical protein
MCFRLNFAKDPIVINTASASVRQLISLVFERVIVEDGARSQVECNNSSAILSPMKLQQTKTAPPNLRPCAADAFLLFRVCMNISIVYNLFQQDLCLLINAEQPFWLSGIQEMTRTLGLELLESVLSTYPSIFVQVIIYIFFV